MAKRKDTDVVQLKLRLVERLRKKLEAAAKAEYRSINSEIVRRLEKSFGIDFSPSEEPGSFLGRLTQDANRLPGARPTFDETDERWQANLRATAEGYRRNAKRHEARGAHEKAAEALETANKIERDAGALTRGQAPRRRVSDQEPELPMPQRDQAKGGKS